MIACRNASAVTKKRCGPRENCQNGNTSPRMVAFVSGYSCDSWRITASTRLRLRARGPGARSPVAV
jgi:hypothetical protein